VCDSKPAHCDEDSVATAVVSGVTASLLMGDGSLLTASFGTDTGKDATEFLSALACCFFSIAMFKFFTALLKRDLLTRMTIIAKAIINNIRFTLREIFMLFLVCMAHAMAQPLTVKTSPAAR
jgi:formate/nitrite transporter FocA (FNT family)